MWIGVDGLKNCSAPVKSKELPGETSRTVSPQNRTAFTPLKSDRPCPNFGKETGNIVSKNHHFSVGVCC